MATNLLETRSCTPKCKSANHVYELVCLLTKTNDVHVLLSGLQQCWNCHRIPDPLGRYIIHLAASCGRLEVVEWLIKHKKADMNVKTLENGWTPLHCSAFYGQIDVFIMLTRLGANLTSCDSDKLTPIEILADNKSKSFSYQPSINDEFDVYTWGSNVNYALGHSNVIEKTQPEMLEYFKKFTIPIVDIVMSKFHTVFRDRNGLVYTCGHGKDGRLGHNNEDTYMIPTLVSCIKDEKCVGIAASRNNSYFLMQDGSVKSCGTNEFKQLGQFGEVKTLVPSPFNMKGLKGLKIDSIQCGKFHCALLSSAKDVYTFGLNAGQLGHPKEQNANTANSYVQDLRILKELVKANVKISAISCSNGATVCQDRDNNRIIYLCYEYKCKRMHIPSSGIEKVKCYGGKLDYQANSDVLDPESGDPLVIVCLMESSTLCIWKESDQTFRPISWTANHKLLEIVDFDLNKNGLIVCTKQGLCYIVDFKKARIVKRPKFTKPKGSDLIMAAEFDTSFEFTELYQVPMGHRCFTVTCDPKGHNYATLQYAPTTYLTYYPIQDPSTLKPEIQALLFDEALGVDTSDICLIYKGKRFHAHKFILASRCEKFFAKQDLTSKTEICLDDQLKTNVSTFQMLLAYVYANRCESSMMADALKASNCNSATQMAKFLQTFKELCEKFDLKTVRQVVDGLASSMKTLKIDFHTTTHLVDLIDTAMRKHKMQLKYFRNSYKQFHDCEIECNDGVVISCHKCILVCRSDYFNNMLLGNWLESGHKRIRLPYDSDLLAMVVDYLYTDEIVYNLAHATTTAAKADKEIEILFNLYVLGDQMLLDRLKSLCEFKLANLISLKSSIEIYRFAVAFNAGQLKDFCSEFICNNLLSLIESKSFDAIDLDLLGELKRFYLAFYETNVGSRRITPYSDGLDVADIELVEPVELLYDPKFLDGTLGGCCDDDLPKRKSTSMPLIADCQQDNNNVATVNNDPSIPLVDQTNIYADKHEAEQFQKWEKVRKKKTKKPNEKIPACANGANKSLVVGAFFTQEDVFNYETYKNSNAIPNKSSAVELKPTKTVVKPCDELKGSHANWATATRKSEKPEVAVWRDANVIKPTSLLDVINEELQRSNTSKPNATIKTIEKSGEPSNVSQKAWNSTTKSIVQKSPSSPAGVATMAQIIEMEQKFKEQYRKLTNRHMDLIQLEEKAIEDLKILYNVDGTFDMQITIEFEEDADYAVLSACAPTWKKF